MSTPEEIFPALEDKHPSVCSLDELEEKYWNEVAPDMLAAGLDPETERPTHRWLSANGHRDLIYALSEYHDTTFARFWEETLGLEALDAGYSWASSDEATVGALEAYLERRVDSKWTESTARTHRARLNRYVWAYEAVTDCDNLLSSIARDSDTPPHEAADACWEAFEFLDARDEISRRTLGRIYRSVSAWYEHLVNRRRTALNPASGLGDEYDWDDGGDGDDKPSNLPLDPDEVRALYQAAHTNEQRTLVVALCAWGLRSGEVACLHRDQLYLEDDDPYIEFDARKNGPGAVNVLYGVHDAQVRLSRLRGDDWNGYVFPSNRAESGHVHPNTIRNRFADVVDRADVDDAAVPQMARRFWYDRYTATMEDLLEHVQDVADEQGSASAHVVLDNYLSEERKRTLRREFMRERLSDAFKMKDT